MQERRLLCEFRAATPDWEIFDIFRFSSCGAVLLLLVSIRREQGGLLIDIGILILRVSIALVMLPHGLHKFEKLDSINVKWRDKYGLPFGAAALAGIIQIVCGVALLVGVFSSGAALILFATMIVATWTSISKEHEPFLSLPARKGWDLNFILVGALIAQIFMGDGTWSLIRLFPSQ